MAARSSVANAGSDVWNYQVKELAEAVARAVPGTKVSINLQAPPDKRSYRVDFSRFRDLAPAHVPQVTLDQSIGMLREGLAGMGFADRNFRNSQQIRLRVLEDHIAAGRLLPSLRWQNGYSRSGGVKFHPTPLKDAYTIELEKRGDDRGFFARFFCQNEFGAAGLATQFVQVNNSLSAKKGTLRGLHNPPYQYSSSKPNVASVDPTTGHVVSTGIGTARISVQDSMGKVVGYDVKCDHVYELVYRATHTPYAQASAWLASIGAHWFSRTGIPVYIQQVEALRFGFQLGMSTLDKWFCLNVQTNGSYPIAHLTPTSRLDQYSTH